MWWALVGQGEAMAMVAEGDGRGGGEDEESSEHKHRKSKVRKMVAAQQARGVVRRSGEEHTRNKEEMRPQVPCL